MGNGPKSFLAVCAFLAAMATCALTLTPVDETSNRYIDLVLEKVGPYIKENNMDPLPLEDQEIGFSKKVLLVTVHGSMSLTGGRIYGLSKIQRAGNCGIRTEGNALILDAKIGVSNMWGAFNGHAQFMGVGVNVKLSLAIDRVTVDANINAKLGASASPELSRFSISSISTITVRCSGLGPLDWVLNPVTNVLVNIIRGVLIKVIEKPLREQVKRALKTIQLP